MNDIIIKLNTAENRSEALDGDKVVGVCDYRKEDNVLDLYHTEVDKSYGGRGIAADLVDCLVAFARENSYKIHPTCSYVVKKFDKDASYKDVDARWKT